MPAGPGIPHPYDKPTKTRLYPHYHSGCGRGTDCPCPPRLALSQAFGHISDRCSSHHSKADPPPTHAGLCLLGKCNRLSAYADGMAPPVQTGYA